MELTTKHIGKKVRKINCLDYDYVVVTGIKSLSGDPYLYGIGVKDSRVVGEFTPERANGRDINGWELVDGASDAFDFARFGCNRQHVEDLMTFLDKRYVHKEK